MTKRPSLVRSAVATGFAALALVAASSAAAGPVYETERIVHSTGGTTAKTQSRAVGSASADLEIFAWAGSSVGSGDPFTLYVEIWNWGPDAASNVTFVDTLPAGVTYTGLGDHSAGVNCTHNAGVVTCTAPAIGVEESIWVNLDLVAPATDGSLTNQVAITAQTPVDPYLGDNSDTTTFSVRSDADVYVYQAASNVALDAPATFHVFLANSGPKAATNVSLVVTLPAETAYVSHVEPDGMDCTQTDHTLTCTVASLPVTAFDEEDEDPPELTVTVGGLSTAGILTSVAQATAAAPADPNPDNNRDAEVVVVGNPPLADLVLFADGGTAVVGTDLVMESEIFNDGPQTATNVTFTDKLPAGLTFVSATVTSGTCAHDFGTVTCTMTSIGNNGSRLARVTVTPTTTGSFKHTVEVSAASPADPDPDGNKDSATIRVLPVGSTSVGLYAFGPDSVVQGADARFTVSVWNDGPSAASNVGVTGTLPAGVEWVGSTTPAGTTCSQAAGAVSCSVGSIAVNSSVSFDLVLRRQTVGAIDVDLTASYALEIEPEDNGTTLSTNVVPAGTADLVAFWWTQSVYTPQGLPMRLRMGARNAGPATAQGATASLTLPAGLAYVSASSAYGPCSQVGAVVTCSLGAIPSGDAHSASVVATPTILGPLLVTGLVGLQAPSVDPESDNNDIATSATIVSAVVSAPSAAMPAADVLTDPATGELQVVTAFDDVAPLTLGVLAQCPGGLPIGANAVGFSHAGFTRTGTVTTGGRYETTYPATQVDATRFYGGTNCGATVWNRTGSVEFFPPAIVVRDWMTNLPVEDAKVTLYKIPDWTPRRGAYQDSVPKTCPSLATVVAATMYSVWPFGPDPTGLGFPVDERGGQISPAMNPQSTNASGEAGWFMGPSACWYFTIEKPGYTTQTSEMFGAGEEDDLSVLNILLHPVMRRLDVTATGPGTVTSDPAGIECPSDCTDSVRDGTTVTLTAQPGPGILFAWSGACAGVTETVCTVELTADRDVGVTFITPDETPPILKVKIPVQKRASVLKTGLATTFTTDEACTLTIELRLTTKMARKLKIPALVGTGAKTFGAAGSAKVKVKLKTAARKKLAKAGTVKITMVIKVKDAAGNARRIERVVTLRA